MIHGVEGDLSFALVFVVVGGFRDRDHLLSVFGAHSSKARKPSRTKGRRRVPRASSSARHSHRGVLSALKRRISIMCFNKGSLTWVGRGTTPSYRLRITSVKARICSLLARFISRRQLVPFPRTRLSRNGWWTDTRHAPLHSCVFFLLFTSPPINAPSPAMIGSVPAATSMPLVLSFPWSGPRLRLWWRNLEARLSL